MTAETESGENNKNCSEITAIPPEVLELIDYLSCNEAIVFKSQQIDDPELQRQEKVAIARDIFEKNRQTFLLRFGAYMKEEHLTTYEQVVIRHEKEHEEMSLMLEDYRNKLKTRRRDVKNRRYTAMQKLIQEGEYFSELEMMKRAPELYQELIGQYLSETEKKQRDSYDVKNTTFSGILMHTMQQREMEDVLREADENNKMMQKLLSQEDSEENSSQSSSSNLNNHNYDEDVPISNRQQWGNFDNEQIACSTSKTSQAEKPKKTEPKFISAGERDLLRQEFLGLMHEQFLEGKDAEFDYTQVDDNSNLDDIQQLNRDKEDAYFEDSDGDDAENLRTIDRPSELNDESEDELDIYMSHLNKHHSLKC